MAAPLSQPGPAWGWAAPGLPVCVPSSLESLSTALCMGQECVTSGITS